MTIVSLSSALDTAKFVPPRFIETNGAWIRLGNHELRVPSYVIVAVSSTADGRAFAVIGHTNNSPTAGAIQILVDMDDGIQEVVGLNRVLLARFRHDYLGR